MASTYGRPNHSAEAHGSFHFGRTLRADAVRLVRIRRLHHFSALLPHRLVGRCGARSSGRVFRSRARTVDGVPVGTREGRASGNTKRNENGDSENGVHDGLPHTRFPSGPIQTGIRRHPAGRRLKSRLAAMGRRVWGGSDSQARCCEVDGPRYCSGPIGLRVSRSGVWSRKTDKHLSAKSLFPNHFLPCGEQRRT